MTPTRGGDNTGLQLTAYGQIAYESYDYAVNILLRIDTSKGISGWGFAAPDPHVTGETAEDVLNVFKVTITKLLLNADPLRPVLHLEKIKKVERLPGGHRHGGYGTA
jgi:L-alanine-DL-glutamate epimerase-like enolase superfamily enzyme